MLCGLACCALGHSPWPGLCFGSLCRTAKQPPRDLKSSVPIWWAIRYRVDKSIFYVFSDAVNLIMRWVVQHCSGFMPWRGCAGAPVDRCFGPIQRQFIQKLLIIANWGLVFTLEVVQTMNMTLNNTSFFDLQNNTCLKCFLEQII